VDGSRSALIVASDDYTDPGLRQLRAPASDAQALAGVLRDPEIGGFEVRTLLNEPAHEVNLAVEEFFADRRPDDLLLLHFSCHGVKDEGGELFFAAANTRLRRLGATAVAAEFVNRRMNRSRSRRVVLLLDCCYAGAFERGMTARAGTGMAIEEQFGGRGRAVITASSAMEYAFEGDELADAREQAPSVFTSALVEGLETGEADRDQDGMVALDELYDYVYDKVQAVTPNQTPGKWTFGVQGDLYIARRSRPVTTPSPLPPELQQAIDHPLASVRAGGVQELSRLLESRHAGLALAGRLALEHLTEDDSRAVSAAATAALGTQAQPAPTESPPPEPATPPQPAPPTPPRPAPPRLALSATAVDFGRLPQNGESPQQRVRLGNAGGGTLNARASTQAGWLELDQVDDELVLAVDTAEVGEHEGVVSVDSDGGSATVRVHAHVHPPPQPAPEPAATPDLARPGARQDATASETPVATALPVVAAAPTPTAPIPDGRLQIAGQLAILGAVLLVVSLFPDYQWGDPVTVRAPGVLWYVLIVAAAAAAAGVCLLLPSTRRLIGPGLLLGIVLASIDQFLSLLSDPLMQDGYESAWGIGLAAYLVLGSAAFLAGLALARAGEVHLARRLPERPLLWLVTLLGVAGAVVMVLFAWRVWNDGWGWYMTQFIWDAAMALVVPAWAAAAIPRRFGASLLVGWAGGGLAIFIFHAVILDSLRAEGISEVGSELIVVFGLILLALLVVAALLVRADPTSQAEHATHG
jgi:hypothetical protein